MTAAAIFALAWRRDGKGWVLMAGRRRFGRVVPGPKYPDMWRSIRADGQLSDMANLSWAKNAVLIVAERDLEFEHRQRRAIDPAKCPENRDVFSAPCPPVGQIDPTGPKTGLSRRVAACARARMRVGR